MCLDKCGFKNASVYDPDEDVFAPADCKHEYRMTIGQRKNFEICILCGERKK